MGAVIRRDARRAVLTSAVAASNAEARNGRLALAQAIREEARKIARMWGTTAGTVEGLDHDVIVP